MALSSQDSARRSDDVLISRLRHQKNPKQLVTQAVSGFSLIEILIVISVLVILGTINFLSLRGMSDTARDSTRLSDIKNLTTSLGYYLTQNGVVPHPSGEVAITYSGATAWYQGTLGMSVVMPLGNPSKQPTDPLLRKEYTYSVTNDESQYQLSGIFEWDTFASNPLTPSVYADSPKYKTFVTGSYNGSVLKIGANIIAVPSIILSDTSTPALKELKSMGGYNFVMKDSYNPPASFKWVTNTAITPSEKPYIPAFENLKNGTSNNIVVWSGSTLPKTISDVDTFSANLKTAYTWAPTSANLILNDIMVSSWDNLRYKTSLLLNTEYNTKINTVFSDTTAGH